VKLTTENNKKEIKVVKCRVFLIFKWETNRYMKVLCCFGFSFGKLKTQTGWGALEFPASILFLNGNELGI
jgi:hypothetical protein